MASLIKLVRNSFRRASPCRAPSLSLHFPSTGFPLVSDSILLEEEHLDEFKAGQYYPANIGDVYDGKDQVLGKLGFGSTSTVWLARNLQYVVPNGSLGKGNRSHPGYPHVRTALDTFKLERPGVGNVIHHCLVQKPMWDSWREVVRWNPAGLFSEELLKASLAKLFLALDYLHSECNIVHTVESSCPSPHLLHSGDMLMEFFGNEDIKADNIMLELVDESVLEAFTQSEMDDPSPRKFVDGVPIYLSRQFGRPRKFGNVVLSDFGAAVRGDQKRNHDAQPNVYRSPEVMLKTEWSYPVDIWNVGVMI
ncbi:hypothetical protein QQZ08_005127 [Neonectria magnoliae]|uniref:non-specific serine/threonine protein kinase n=1 Tax=Neonectria magnoliae TaxID=2732573 RepID=A0ABR1I4A3_9HYPO